MSGKMLSCDLAARAAASWLSRRKPVMCNRSTLLVLLASSLWLCALPALAASAAIPADGEPCKGKLEIGGKTYTLKYAVAYSVKVFDEVATSVIFAEQPVPVEKLKAALRDGK